MPSRYPSSSPSLSSISPKEQPKKSSRAGKAKVRTGCITCKIRRVKCDEATPSCTRCTSTGRKCDGYGPRPKPPKPTGMDAALQQLTLPPASGHVSIKSSSVTPLFRPLVADIPGDRTERLYFHDFRQIAEEALGIRHIHTGLFWKQIVPQYCHDVAAVRHAYIAVGAAYRHFHLSGYRPDTNAAPTDIEQFVIKQYTLAMKHIPRESSGLPMKRQYGIIMMCCVAFVCIEILRGDWDKALAHLTNGLRLMSDLPEDVADILHNPAKFSQGMDTSYVRVSYMIQLLTRWELSAGYLDGAFRPSLTLQAYRARELDYSYNVATARSVEELQDVVDSLCQDINAFSWQTRPCMTDSEFCDDPNHKLQYWVLHRRSDNLAHMLETHDNTQNISFQSCLLNHRVAAMSLDSISIAHQTTNGSVGVQETERIQDLVDIASVIRDMHQSSDSQQEGRDRGIDVGVIPTLHVAKRHCQDKDNRDSLDQLIQNWPKKQSLWDGQALRELHISESN